MDPQAIERWQRESFPAIAAQAKRQGAQIFFWDESGFRADAVHGKTWGKKGQTPVVERPGQRQSISAASAVNARGGFWYCTYQGGLNAEAFVSLLHRMMRRRSKPVHLVLDGLPAHKTKLVKTYVASTKGMLTLHFLPGYAPELNPDELVWSHMKRTGVDPDALNVRFVKGLYEDTLHVDEPVAFAHIDCDWYDSVKLCIDRLAPLMSVGGVMLFDDYNSFSGCRRAVDEWLPTDPRFKIIHQDWTVAIQRVPDGAAATCGCSAVIPGIATASAMRAVEAICGRWVTQMTWLRFASLSMT